MHKDINVAVGGPVNADYPKVYKTKVLKPNLPFALQVTEPNTKYVIKHKFDLGCKGSALSDVDFTDAQTHEVGGVTFYYVPIIANGNKYTLLDDSCVFVTSDWTGLSTRTITPEAGTRFMIGSVTGGLHEGAYTQAEMITMPESCILEFDGGSLDNGFIIGQDTLVINVGDVDIWGENLTREGIWREHSGGGEGNVMVRWFMLDNESNNRDNSTDYCKRYASSKAMLSLVGLEKVYFEQTVKDLEPIFDKIYILAVKFQWYNENGSWVQTDDYVNLNTDVKYFDIPTEAVGGYATFNLTIISHNAAIFKEVVEAAKIYTNLVGESRLIYNENAPTKWMADERRYDDSLYLPDTVITRLGYSEWRIGDSEPDVAVNDVWEKQIAGVVSDYIIDITKFANLYRTKYNAIVVEGDDTYNCWFTFVTKYPETPGERVQQSSVYGTRMRHVYVGPKQILTRLIPDDAKYLVVSWRHGGDDWLTPERGYWHPKSIRFINTDINAGALSYAKIRNDKFVALAYPTLAANVNKSTNVLNELKLCSWNIGHWSMGDYPYSTISDDEQDQKKAELSDFVFNRLGNPEILLFNEYENKFSSKYYTEDILDYRIMWNRWRDRYCNQALYSNVFMQLLDVVYFPYSLYLVDDQYTDSMDYFCVYRTYLNNHSIIIASIHLRSEGYENHPINDRQCQYLIDYLKGYRSVVILGDFNRTDMSVFSDAGYTVKIDTPTYPHYGTSLDHFVYKGLVSISSEKVVETSLSDHYAIIATLTTTDNKKITGSYNDRPSDVLAGYEYFDTTLNKPVYKTEFGFWVDSNGNPVSDWWKTLGVLDENSELFEDKSVIVEQNTYNSSWGGWANKKNNTIYRREFTINGNPFTAGQIIEIFITGAVKNFEWNLAYLDSTDTPVYYIIDGDTTRTYNIDRRIIKIPEVEGELAKVKIKIACDIDYFSGKIAINKWVA